MTDYIRVPIEIHPKALLIDIVDPQWASAKLPNDDLVLLEDNLFSAVSDAAGPGSGGNGVVGNNINSGIESLGSELPGNIGLDMDSFFAISGDSETMGPSSRSKHGISLLTSNDFSANSNSDLFLAGILDPEATGPAAQLASNSIADPFGGRSAILKPAAILAALAASRDSKLAQAFLNSGASHSLIESTNYDFNPPNSGDPSLFLENSLINLEYIQSFRNGNMNAALLSGDSNISRLSNGMLPHIARQDRWIDLDLTYVGTRFHHSIHNNKVGKKVLASDFRLEAELDADTFDLERDLMADKEADLFMQQHSKNKQLFNENEVNDDEEDDEEEVEDDDMEEEDVEDMDTRHRDNTPNNFRLESSDVEIEVTTGIDDDIEDINTLSNVLNDDSIDSTVSPIPPSRPTRRGIRYSLELEPYRTSRNEQ